jgi:hypothetical protein
MKKFSSSPNGLFMFLDYKETSIWVESMSTSGIADTMLKTMASAPRTRRTHYEGSDKKAVHIHVCHPRSGETEI